MIRIKPERVAHGLRNLAEWRKSVQSQASVHLLPLLALLESGAGDKKQIQFGEQQDFEFWNRYFRLQDGNAALPYFNPIVLRRVEAGYPHSNAATIRKNTFGLKWRAGTLEKRGSQEFWQLAPDYADIIRDKVLTRAGKVTRAPVLDLAVILFRDREFEDGTEVEDLEAAFRREFRQEGSDYDKVFEFVAEEKGFVFDRDDIADYEPAIRATLLSEDIKSARAPAPESLRAELPADDFVLQQVQQLLELGTSGILLTGSPGTGKTYYAHRIAQHLTADHDTDIFKVQFHPSYGYEDFVEGFRPTESAKSGFEVADKVFIDACERARQTSGKVVLLVDEINRGDPARVFGELLTYIERPYRREEFKLPFSGRPFSVPDNLLLIATMNPHDRSVSHVDAAFVRRFDTIEIPPSREVIEELLEDSGGFTPEQVTLIGNWFDEAQKMVTHGLGHSFFADVKSVDSLKLVWRYRMLPTALTAIELDEGKSANFTSSFDALIRRLEGVVGDT